MMSEPSALPQAGEVWARTKDGVRVLIVETPRSRFGFVRLRWPNGRVSDKRVHYFMYEFEGTPEETGDGKRD